MKYSYIAIDIILASILLECMEFAVLYKEQTEWSIVFLLTLYIWIIIVVSAIITDFVKSL